MRMLAIIILAVAILFFSGCASVGTYFQDRALDFVDCFKLDAGIFGAGAEVHFRVTDALSAGIGAGFTVNKIGFKGRFLGTWNDFHF